MKRVIFIVILIILLPFIINIPDESLRKEAQVILEQDAVPIEPKSDNGFYAAMAFEAQSGKDIDAVGRDASVAYAKSQNTTPPLFEFSLREFTDPQAEMPGRGQVPECFPEKESSCLDFYAGKKDKVVSLKEANGLLLERYKRLLGYRFFQNTTQPAPWEPLIRLEGPIFAGHLLSVAHAAILFSHGKVAEALKDLSANILLWRKLLAGVTDLPGKTYAFLALRLNFTLLEEMLHRVSAGGAPIKLNPDVATALTQAEMSTDLVWDRYFKALAWSLSNDRRPFETGGAAKISFLESCFFKSNATLNDAQRMFASLKELATIEPAKVEAARDAFRKQLDGIAKTGFKQLYNPLGKQFITDSFDDKAAVYLNRDIHSLNELVARLRNKASAAQKQ